MHFSVQAAVRKRVPWQLGGAIVCLLALVGADSWLTLQIKPSRFVGQLVYESVAPGGSPADAASGGPLSGCGRPLLVSPITNGTVIVFRDGRVALQRGPVAQPVISEIGRWPGSNGAPLTAAAVDGDEFTLALGDESGSLRVISPGRLASAAEEAPYFMAHEGAWIDSLTFTSAGRCLVSRGGKQRGLRVWNAADMSPLATIATGHTEVLDDVAVAAAGNSIIWSRKLERVVEQYAVPDGALLQTLDDCEPAAEYVDLIVPGHDHEHCVGATNRGRVVVWRLSDGAIVRTEKMKFSPIGVLAASPAGPYVVLSPFVADGSPRRLLVWNYDTGELQGELDRSSSPVFGEDPGPDRDCVAWSSDGTCVVAVYTSGVVRIWQVF